MCHPDGTQLKNLYGGEYGFVPHLACHQIPVGGQTPTHIRDYMDKRHCKVFQVDSRLSLIHI